MPEDLKPDEKEERRVEVIKLLLNNGPMYEWELFSKMLDIGEREFRLFLREMGSDGLIGKPARDKRFRVTEEGEKMYLEALSG